MAAATVESVAAAAWRGGIGENESSRASRSFGGTFILYPLGAEVGDAVFASSCPGDDEADMWVPHIGERREGGSG